MEPKGKPPDLLTETALRSLKDIAVPSPISMRPETWGWALLALAVICLLGVLVVWRIRCYRSARYRREALAELRSIEKRLDNPLTRKTAEHDLNALLKRTALAGWQRKDVAALSGGPWVKFLIDHSGDDGIDGELALVLDDIEYRGDDVSLPFNADKNLVAAARKWIRTHHVSA